MRHIARSILVCGCLALACGGEAVESPEDGERDPSDPNGTSNPQATSSSQGSSDDGDDGDGQVGDTQLGECALGWTPGSGAGGTCPWMAKERCYAKKLDACACICPAGDTSVCVSGFPDGPYGKVPVSCD